jgi:hypothetical protein
MRGSGLGAALVMAVALLGLPARLDAEPLVLLGAQYGAPMRTSASVGILRSADPGRGSRSASSSHTRSGLLIAGTVGTGGEQFALGLAGLVTERSYLLIYGFDIRATLTRTRKSPRGATPESTYGGVEAGLTVSILRVSAGYGRRLSSVPAADRNAFTWSVGAQFPLGW